MRWTAPLLLVCLGAAGCDVLFGVTPGGGGGGRDAGADGSPTTDGDGDGVFDDADNCVAVGNFDQANEDGDLEGDACDRCPQIATSAASVDTDEDGVGDDCDPEKLAPTSRWYTFEGFTTGPAIDCPAVQGSGNPDEGWACIRAAAVTAAPMVSGGALLLASPSANEVLGMARSDGSPRVQRIEASLDVAVAPGGEAQWAYVEAKFDGDDDQQAMGTLRCGLVVRSGSVSAYYRFDDESGAFDEEMSGGVDPASTARLDVNAEGVRCQVGAHQFPLWSAPGGRATSVGVFADNLDVAVPYVAAVVEGP